MDLRSKQDMIIADEISGTIQSASSSASSPKPRNAFNALMSSKRKASPSSSPLSSKKPHSSNPKFDRRSGLGAYISAPEKYDAHRVIFYNDHFVAIHDLYPKSSVHCLLLPRSEKYQLMHPFDAFEDPEFLAACREEAAKLKSLVAKELRRNFGRFSTQDKHREAVLNGEIELADDEPLPLGRDWEQEVITGVHAHPSMAHLHIHVISKDRYSESLKHRKHYNSFSTPFFVELDAFPLMGDDKRRHPGREGYLQSDMKCWKCGKAFGNKFARLKEHLAAEFEEWKKE